MVRERRKQFSAGIYSGSGFYLTPLSYSFSFAGGQTTFDEIHAWPGTLPGLRDIGGSFYSSTYLVESGPVDVDLSRSATNWYKGPLFAWEESSGTAAHEKWTKTPPLTADELNSKGATAISRVAPTNPHASLSQALGEARRDGIPALPGLQAFQKGVRPIARAKKKKRGPKGTRSSYNSLAGSEYLNVEFGWKPLLSDVSKLATAGRSSERILSQYVRDAGRLVRRRYDFPDSVTETIEVMGTNLAAHPALNGYLQSLGGTLTRTTRVTRRVWFSGAFTYHVSDGDDIVSRTSRFVQEANHLTGGGITPAAMWDIMPYSWAVDWVTNIGDVVNTASMMASDGLIVVYGYIMAETTTVKTYKLSGGTVRVNNALRPRPTLTQSFTEIVKQRGRANPFGFGVTGLPTTARQLAIIAALGLSRDGRKLAL